MIFRLALQSLISRRFSAWVCIAMITLSAIALLTVDTLYRGTQSAFGRSVQGIDLIVGAPTGDINLLLFSAFQVGAPSRELSYATFTRWQQDSNVKRAVPLMLGDSHKGYRVIGTNSQLFSHIGAISEREVFAQGHAFKQVFEVTLGHEVAQQLGYHIGDELILSHGLGNHSFQHHDARRFRIAGVLAATGTPIDKTLQVSLEGLEAIHWPPAQLAQLPEQLAIGESPALQPDSIAAFYLTLTNKVRTFQVQRAINQSKIEPSQAILPGVAITQLWSMLDWIEAALLGLGVLTALVATIGVLSTLLTHLDKRMSEFRLLQTLGASRRYIFTLLGLETALLVTLGLFTGVALTITLERGLTGFAQSQWGLYWPLNLHWPWLIAAIPSAALASGILLAGVAALRLKRRL
ncbi:ABC transporter permease [Gilvimarinus agarilyticus]|uniref:ABC transporter permease n=1 Tax=Gilvimarinus sp. 2_MG-2023 TaxID=3062666 RepID=UPI001C08416E|nr:FtsX-like permease family protein [Gilvimarinus sp. 2_MG-2023]MBU2884379.1 ABC transporter permease [Gilvimarinus agarilyticus]MDO6569515.1 ABC transporter permease [Gilvimarinus sp. 2_MG-2023]